MYVYDSKPAPEHQPPTTLPELLGYLRRLLSNVGRDRVGYHSTHTVEFRTGAGQLVVVEQSSVNAADYCYQETKRWKRWFETPTLRVRVNVPNGATLRTLFSIAHGATELPETPCASTLEHYLTPDLKPVTVPPRLSTTTAVLALESDLTWAGWLVGYHPLGFDLEGVVRFSAHKDGVECKYDLEGNLALNRLIPLGYYQNGYTPYWVHGKLVEDKLSKVPAIRRLQFDHVIGRMLTRAIPWLFHGEDYAKQQVCELFSAYPVLSGCELDFFGVRTEAEIRFPSSVTTTRFKIERGDDGYLFTAGKYITHIPLNKPHTEVPIGLPTLFTNLSPEEAFLRYYGVEGGWAGWFKSRENKE